MHCISPSSTPTLLGTAVALILSIAPALAQINTSDREDAAPPLFIDRIDIDVVNVEVFVADRDGNPVTGLAASDFKIYEDGTRVEITNFYTVLRQDPALDAETLTLEDLRAAPPPAPPEILLPEDQQLSLVVYMDHFNLHPGHRRRVLDDLAGFLEDRTIRGDRTMLMGYDGTLSVTTPFTRNVDDLFAGLARLGKAATHRPIDDAERRRAMRQILDDATAGTGQLESAHQIVRSFVQQEKTELRATARALLQTVRSLAGLPGRKALLYISSGIPKRPGEDLYILLQNLFGSAAFQGASTTGEFIDPAMAALHEDESDLFDRIVREANAQQVTFYPVDARGHGGESSLSAEFAGALSQAIPGGRATFDQTRTESLQEPLLEMAKATGGRAFVNTFNFEDAFARTGRDFDTFYSLGYRPAQGRDGAQHRIEVEVSNPEFRVRHRETYENKPERERVGDRTLSSLVLDMAVNPLDVRMEFGPPEKKGLGKKFELPVLVRVPIDRVAILPNGDLHEGRLHFYVAVQDEEGISNLHREAYPIQIPATQIDAAKGQELGYSVRLLIRGGSPKIAVGVWDELSGTESFIQQKVQVKKEKRARN